MAARNDALRLHPAYARMVQRYRTARYVWADGKDVREVAESVGWTERTWCAAYVSLNYQPICWSASTTDGEDWTQQHDDAAFEEAGCGSTN